ncbi:hypothetical protein [Glycomyces dulcitolivorans]|jgi:hypothetical protein|uniref:hypothetical protein n=1 Tax=Glycomyces dulcitolivorans TaxID=2200759 RepID=UPI000DD4AF45|nr:hypothetical protein [Glycomyces dulcitolivorans]
MRIRTWSAAVITGLAAAAALAAPAAASPPQELLNIGVGLPPISVDVPGVHVGAFTDAGACASAGHVIVDAHAGYTGFECVPHGDAFVLLVHAG